MNIRSKKRQTIRVYKFPLNFKSEKYALNALIILKRFTQIYELQHNI